LTLEKSNKQQKGKMKKEHKELIAFLKKYGGWQWYGNDRSTRKLVEKLVNRNFCIKRKEKLDNGYIFREIKLAKSN